MMGPKNSKSRRETTQRAPTSPPTATWRNREHQRVIIINRPNSKALMRLQQLPRCHESFFKRRRINSRGKKRTHYTPRTIKRAHRTAISLASYTTACGTELTRAVSGRKTGLCGMGNLSDTMPRLLRPRADGGGREGEEGRVNPRAVVVNFLCPNSANPE